MADRAMFNKNNLELMDSLGVNYFVTTKIKSMPAEVKKDILNFASTVNKKVFSVMKKDVEGRRLIVNYSPDRAKKDFSEREIIINRLKKQLDKDNKIEVSKLAKNQGTKNI